MIYKTIPNTDLSISVVSLGTWLFGGDVWGNAAESDCISVVHAAIDCGINLIDTAPIYGYGRSEEIVGKAIKKRRNEIIIETKCGLRARGGKIETDLSAAFIKEEIKNSLTRLGVDYIDIYICHWPDTNVLIEETMTVLTKLQKEGIIKYIGLSNHQAGQVEKAMSYGRITVLQNHYSLLERSIEKELLPFCCNKGIGMLAYGCLGGGILTGKYISQPSFSPSDARSFFYGFYKGLEFERANKVIAKLKEVSTQAKNPLNEIAINWIRQKEGITSAIVGARNTEQVRANAASANWSLSEEDITKLNS